MIESTDTSEPFTRDPLAGVEEEEVRFAAAKLRLAGLRLTRPRLSLLTALSRRGEPSRIEQLHRDVAESGCDLVTVYRCMVAFEDIGLVQRAFLHDGTSVYRLNVVGAPRYYIVCRATNQVDELEPQFARQLRTALGNVEDMLRARGYRDIAHMVEFFAIRDSPPSPAQGQAEPAIVALPPGPRPVLSRR